MEKEIFVNNVIAEGWEWLPVNDGGELKKGLVVKKVFDSGEVKLHLTDKCIDMYNWETLIKKMNSHNVYHMTRVVGYYSRVSNWNPSKIGELKDRQRGDYAFKKSITG